MSEEYARYTVRYRLAGSDVPWDKARVSPVSLIKGYSTFEAIRTILAVVITGRQDPDMIEILSVQLIPTEAEEAAVKDAIVADQSNA